MYQLTANIMLTEHEHKVRINLKKARGQLALIEKMLADKRYCVDVAQQINAAIGLLKQANNIIFESHLLSCGAHKLNSKRSADKLAFAKELIKAFTLTNKN